MLRSFLAHGPTFDEANWSMISEQLTVQMELLANQSLKLVGLESTPAAGAATATGDILKGSTKAPVPRAEAGGAGCRYGSGTCTACARCSLCRGRSASAMTLYSKVMERNTTEQLKRSNNHSGTVSSAEGR
ncbi:hypothetical protein [Streptomyces tauricus]|uniref:hypothetical protein n=1 Tax=Streptomyces tauricus TaxID=68274 RepID=UPI002244C952|nr:hypothetical protein [Streptomyces tauricus]MCW8102853.1 hypothetical protein [Streptomyces tauricus]